MTRIDLALDNVHLAFSTDDGDDTEWGLSTMLGDYFLRAGYETDAKDLQIAVGRDMGGWGFHTVYHNDLDDSGSADQLAGTLLYDVSKSLRVAGSVAINGDRELDSYGLIAWYEFGEGVSSSFGPATLRLQYVDDINSDNKSIELAINLPFGNQAPSFYERNAKKEDYSGFGYY